MKAMKPLILALLLAATGPAFAACPPFGPERAEDRDRLLEAVRAAPDERSAQSANNDMWRFWSTAPDARAQQLLDDGMRHRGYGEYYSALSTFDDLIAYCPHYAEGYNQRAFIHFLEGRYAEAVTDLEAALERAPQHYGALAGLASTLLHLGRVQAGQSVLRRALALNPWLPERRLLIEDAAAPRGKPL